MTASELIEALFEMTHEGGPADWLEKEIRVDIGPAWPTVIEVDEKGSCIVLRTKTFGEGGGQ